MKAWRIWCARRAGDGMSIFDLSLRFKIPLLGSIIIIATALGLSLSYMVQARTDLKRDMLENSEGLGRVLAHTLQSPLLHDDVWRGFEIVNTLHGDEASRGSFQVEGLIVLNEMHEVFVSSHPDAYPLLIPLGRLGNAFRTLSTHLDSIPLGQTLTLETDDKILQVVPLVADDVVLGHLILVHPAEFFWPRFKTLAGNTAIITGLALAFLLPVNWYWGQRMARPLVLLSRRMDDLGRTLPEPLPHTIYPYGDELGCLFDAYDRMLEEREVKTAMEREIVKEGRLAALGRLSAGIAHEINNPLGGLMTAVDTLKQYGEHDTVSRRVLPLLERGLVQIKDIVAALLVEAKGASRKLTWQDVEDAHTLLAEEARKRRVAWQWDNRLQGELDLPATPVRQVLINMLLNAVQAAGPEGRVEAHIQATDAELSIEVGNGGDTIPPEQMDSLFEPFASRKETGHGLGLWISYQIVTQLSGHIGVESRDGWTRFSVALPMENETCTTAASA
ncbi:MAG: two-component sensor histidine kinase [Thiobacillus sp.]|nr:two-component sensor histidine kinase [Thiobacillus sp.]